MRWKLRFVICLEVGCLMFGFVLPASAMGQAPKKPEYKLEILKMELIPSASSEVVLNKTALLVIAPKDFQDQEYAKPKKALEKAGVKVAVASTRSTAVGMYGAKVRPDLLVKDAKAADYDAVVFIGGDGALALVDDPQALSLAIEAQKNQKVIGAICIAPMILAKAGVVEGKKVSVSPYGRSRMRGATCTGDKVTVDGKIITGRGPEAAEEFGQALVKALQK